MCGFLVYTAPVRDQSQEDRIKNNFEKIHHRGPDRSSFHKSENAWWGFHRLAIMDTTTKGDQPFFDKETGNIVVCNGEIFNFEKLSQCVGYKLKSHSDCEVLLPAYKKYGIEQMCRFLDGEFAFVLYDGLKKKTFAARDPMGIRPMFYGTTKEGHYVFSSEMKSLHNLCGTVQAFPPGHWFDGESFHPYIDLKKVREPQKGDLKPILSSIQSFLTKAVEKRLESDVPLGFLLSGGLDSSLVCAIGASKWRRPIKTFAIGMVGDAIDLKYAKTVANHLKSDHCEVFMSEKDVIDYLPEVIKTLETWDVTTIRASIGMYLVCKYVREQSDVRVLLTGEVSDELFGYKYTDFAPSPEAFQKESEKRITELYYYDVLRADRCIAAHGLEARVPFSDTNFVKYIMSIDPQIKMNSYGVGKYLLRMAFKDSKILPESILMREKSAFSDAVGHSMVDILKDYAEKQYSNASFEERVKEIEGVKPLSKEALLYREIFSSFYQGRENIIPGYWLPNQTWENCNITDPSARFLPNYGDSGS